MSRSARWSWAAMGESSGMDDSAALSSTGEEGMAFTAAGAMGDWSWAVWVADEQPRRVAAKRERAVAVGAGKVFMGHRGVRGEGGEIPAGRWGLFTENRDEFDIEDEGGFGGDAGSASFAVGEGVGDDEFSFAAHFHGADAFGPAGDDAVEGEGGGGTAIDGAIEFCAVVEPAGIVDGNAGGRTFWGGAITDDHIVVFESGGGFGPVAGDGFAGESGHGYFLGDVAELTGGDFDLVEALGGGRGGFRVRHGGYFVGCVDLEADFFTVADEGDFHGGGGGGEVEGGRLGDAAGLHMHGLQGIGQGEGLAFEFGFEGGGSGGDGGIVVGAEWGEGDGTGEGEGRGEEGEGGHGSWPFIGEETRFLDPEYSRIPEGV